MISLSWDIRPLLRGDSTAFPANAKGLLLHIHTPDMPNGNHWGIIVAHDIENQRLWAAWGYSEEDALYTYQQLTPSTAVPRSGLGMLSFWPKSSITNPELRRTWKVKGGIQQRTTPLVHLPLLPEWRLLAFTPATREYVL